MRFSVSGAGLNRMLHLSYADPKAFRFAVSVSRDNL